MPVYEYECAACGGRFEVIQKFSDPALTECKACGAAEVRKVLSTPAFVLKGNGWYVTDYASPDRKKAMESESPKKDSSSSSTDASSPASSACPSGACAGSCPSKG
jgi:putative FmdB family regulatory protein